MTTAEKLIKKGKFEGKLETAKNMLLDGASLEYVLKITGLTEQELKDYGVI
ncbi:hypothetical protein LEP1GSC105_3598 [Leptospira interrogans str. UI 12758]|uniref:Transposase n=3 Tax=Leptospira interrogans TaxID=173 RepID=A0A0E2DBG2_LEPIR|nr:hypothetical protein LEP1GSC105_3598 [Leptospira interrogans str. UI 12758]EMN82452.1 hypothetical protein LEP1GSC106_0514 [Leptospira interrogans serovar Grippotyphosa str. UI 12764]